MNSDNSKNKLVNNVLNIKYILCLERENFCFFMENGQIE